MKTMKEFHVGCFAVAVISFVLFLFFHSQSQNPILYAIAAFFACSFLTAVVLWPLVMLLYLPSTMAMKAMAAIRTARPHASGDLIERLCKQTGMTIVSRSGDQYQVRTGDNLTPVEIDIRYD